MKIELQLDYKTILRNSSRPVHLVAKLTAPAQALTQRPRPTTFTVVLDRSGSMSGETACATRLGAARWPITIQAIQTMRGGSSPGGFENVISTRALDSIGKPTLDRRSVRPEIFGSRVQSAKGSLITGRQ